MLGMHQVCARHLFRPKCPRPTDEEDEVEVCALCCQKHPTTFSGECNEIIGQSVLTHAVVGTRPFRCNTCHTCFAALTLILRRCVEYRMMNRAHQLTLAWTKKKKQVARVLQVEFTNLILCCVLCREGFGVDCGTLWGPLEGRMNLGLKSGYLVPPPPCPGDRHFNVLYVNIYYGGLCCPSVTLGLALVSVFCDILFPKTVYGVFRCFFRPKIFSPSDI